MDEFAFLILLVLAFFAIPWVLGIVALVKAAALRRDVAGLQATDAERKGHIQELAAEIVRLRGGAPAAAAEPAATEAPSRTPAPSVAADDPAEPLVSDDEPAFQAAKQDGTAEEPGSAVADEMRPETVSDAGSYSNAASTDASRPPRNELVDRLFALVRDNLLIMVGGIAITVGVIFLINYTIAQGLLGPVARCILGAVAGLGLIGLGEAVLRSRQGWANGLPTAAPLVLYATGFLALFGITLVATTALGLLPLTLGFALMGLISWIALLTWERMGPVMAALGLVGAFIVPMLVNTGSNDFVGLFIYLAIPAVTGLVLARRQDWSRPAVMIGLGTIGLSLFWIFTAFELMPADGSAWNPLSPVVFALTLSLFTIAIVETNSGPVFCLRRSFLNLRPSLIAVLATGGSLILLALSAFDANAATGAHLLALAILTIIAFMLMDRASVYQLLPVSGLVAVLLLLNFAPLEYFSDQSLFQPNGEFTRDFASAFVPSPLSSQAWLILLSALGFAGLTLIYAIRTSLRLPEHLRGPVIGWATLVMTAAPLTLAFLRLTDAGHQVAWGMIAGLIALIFLWLAQANRMTTHRLAAYSLGALTFLGAAAAVALTQRGLSLIVSLEVLAVCWLMVRFNLKPLRWVLVLASLVMLWLTFTGRNENFLSDEPALADILLNYLMPAIVLLLAGWLTRTQENRALAFLHVITPVVASAAGFTLIFWFVTTVLDDAGFSGAAGFGGWATMLLTVGVLTARTSRFVSPVALGRTAIAFLGLGWLFTAIVVGGLVNDGAVWAALTGERPGIIPLDEGIMTVLVSGLFLFALPSALLWRALPHATDLLPKHEGKITIAVWALVGWLGLSFVNALIAGTYISRGAQTLSQPELYTYSVVWLALGAGLLLYSIRISRRLLSHVAFAIIYLVVAKVFLMDASGLEGLLRITSFFGLGLALVGLGLLQRRLTT